MNFAVVLGVFSSLFHSLLRYARSQKMRTTFTYGGVMTEIPPRQLQTGAFAMLTAGQIMTTNIVTTRPNVSIEAAIDTLLSEEISGLPVTDDDGRLIGVITEFALLAVAYDRRVKNHTVSQHMTREVISVDIEDPISRVADLCIVHRVRRVPVMKDGRLVGIISRRDVLRALIQSPTAVCTA
jgi:CBS domain-containing protein